MKIKMMSLMKKKMNIFNGINPTNTSVQRPRQDTSGDVKVPMTQDAMTKNSQCNLKNVLYKYCV